MGWALLRKVIDETPELAEAFRVYPTAIPTDMVARINAAFSTAGDTNFPGLNLANTKLRFDEFFPADGEDYRTGMLMPILLNWSNVNDHRAWRAKCRRAVRPYALRIIERIVIANLKQASPADLTLSVSQGPHKFTLIVDESIPLIEIDIQYPP